MEEDLLLKEYLSDNERYADLFNGFFFSGEQVICAKSLHSYDTQTGYVRNGKRNRKVRYRDLMRRSDFGLNFAVIGIENQKYVHYLMPLRVMSYESAEYENQAYRHRKRVRKEKEVKNSEFLSGFRKTDRLRPCVTIVLYYGDDWDGSRDLYDIMDFTDIPESLRKCVNHYRINLLEIKKLDSTEVFHTDVKLVFDFIRCGNDKKKLKKLVEDNEEYHNMEEDAYDVAAFFTRAKELIQMKQNYIQGGKVDMCQALTELINDGRMEGRQEGRQEERRIMMRMVTAMIQDGHAMDVSRLADDEDFYREMIDKYEIQMAEV